MRYKAIVIGVSAGGLDALGIILPALDANLPLPVLVVQHISPQSDSYMVKHLNAICSITVKEAEDKENPKPGVIYVAPPNYHLLVEPDGVMSLSMEDRVNFARPSIDVLFESAADAWSPDLIGIILTGANEDGSMGLAKIKSCGGLTIVQDPATAFVDRMPKAAIAGTTVDYILPLDEIGPLLNQLTNSTIME
ncbi:MAG: glutamate methylesterase [Deltaproteobacteria bacterium RIFOXYD12_FULL_50_9]|nr:MAG: glutamate methylesterase [Deltaproteobacteria bacterium RIFOXYD12_FULL_50_9]